MDFLGNVVAWFTDPANIWGVDGLLNRLWEHAQLSATALVLAMVIALPAGLVTGHTGRGGLVATNVSNLGRAIPSLTFLGVAFFLFGIGNTPALVALMALAVPPMVTNTYTAVRGVDPEVRESAIGMGLTGAQLLRRVELPMGLPLIMAGIRTSGVQVVATATLAAYVGGGGLGRFIRSGLATRDFPELFAGALGVALLSLGTEIALGAVQRVVVPKGLQARGGEALSVRPGAATAANPTASVAG
jgi:osmoprotectant transport system permease protein